MSLSDREKLVQLAREFDALIVTDDVYDFLQWSADLDRPLAAPDKAHMPRLVDIDRYLDGGPPDEWGNVVSNGSFSKLIGPGMRTGWAEGSAKFAYGLSQAYCLVIFDLGIELSELIIWQRFVAVRRIPVPNGLHYYCSVARQWDFPVSSN
jgi:DNA-binding transcriptional MocR family regulator